MYFIYSRFDGVCGYGRLKDDDKLCRLLFWGMNDYFKIDYVVWVCMCVYIKFYRILFFKWMNYIFY